MSGSTEKVAAEAEAQHADGGGGERTTKEAHGGTGKVGDVAEGEVVDLGTACDGKERDDIGAGSWAGSGDCEVSADGCDRGGERDEYVEVPVEGATVGG